MTNSLKSILIGTVLSVPLAEAALASETSPPAIEEIVVTAQRSAESARDVPISITALTGDDLAKAGVTSSLDLQKAVPGLVMTRVGNYTTPAIRGVSNFITVPGADPNVATYIDGVYQSNPTALTFDMPDVERVEVLKGPQGTLFGRNATGGAVRIFTRDPKSTFTGEISGTYANYKDQSVKLFLAGPIAGDTVTASIAGFEQTADSYYNNLTPSVPLRPKRAWGVRGKLKITPGVDTRIVLAGYLTRNDSSAVQLVTPINGISVAQGFPGSIIPSKPLDVAQNVSGHQDVKTRGISLSIDQETPVGELKLLASYESSDVFFVTPNISAALAAPYKGTWYIGEEPGDSKQVELNFVSKEFGRFKFIVGANYYKAYNAFQPLNINNNIPANVLAGRPASTFLDVINTAQGSQSYGVFAEGTYRLTDTLTLIGGVRYSSEKRTIAGNNTLTQGINGDPAGNPPKPFYEYGHRSDSNVTWRASLRYAVTDDTNVYFTTGTGFRSGLYNATAIPFALPNGSNAPAYVRPEHITSYELGLKTRPRSWLSADAAVFYYHYTDQQQAAYILVGGVPLGVVANAATSKIKGAEFNLSANLTSEFSIRLGGSYVDGEFGSFPNATWNIPAPFNNGQVTVNRDASGKRMPRTPKFTGTLSVAYAKDLDAGTLTLGGNAYRSSKVYFDIGNLYAQPSYTLIGLRAAFAPRAVPGLELAVWGRNITDERVVLAHLNVANGAGFAYDEPARYGATIAYKF